LGGVEDVLDWHREMPWADRGRERWGVRMRDVVDGARWRCSPVNRPVISDSMIRGQIRQRKENSDDQRLENELSRIGLQKPTKNDPHFQILLELLMLLL
jgi:hypothetical protein